MAPSNNEGMAVLVRRTSSLVLGSPTKSSTPSRRLIKSTVTRTEDVVIPDSEEERVQKRMCVSYNQFS
jgi:hypothetical protein